MNGYRQLEVPGGGVLSECGFLAEGLGGKSSLGLDASPPSPLWLQPGDGSWPPCSAPLPRISSSYRLAVGFSLGLEKAVLLLLVGRGPRAVLTSTCSPLRAGQVVTAVSGSGPGGCPSPLGRLSLLTLPFAACLVVCVLCVYKGPSLRCQRTHHVLPGRGDPGGGVVSSRDAASWWAAPGCQPGVETETAGPAGRPSDGHARCPQDVARLVVERSTIMSHLFSKRSCSAESDAVLVALLSIFSRYVRRMRKSKEGDEVYSWVRLAGAPWAGSRRPCTAQPPSPSSPVGVPGPGLPSLDQWGDGHHAHPGGPRHGYPPDPGATPW